MAEVTLKPSAQRILSFIQMRGSITGVEAVNFCSAADYRKRISEMRAAGIPIKDRWETGSNQFGETVRYKKYFLEETAQ